MAELGNQSAEHPDIVTCLELIGSDQRVATDFVQRILQLRQPVSGVDIHQDQSRLCRGVKRQDPLDLVGRPNSDWLPWLQAQGDKARGKAVNLTAEFRVGKADVPISDNNSFPV